MIAGGVESMSRAPFVMPKADSAFSRNNAVFDTTIGWRFVNPVMKQLYGTDSMPETAENVAQEFGVARSDQDAFALRSHQRAVAATDEGRFYEEIISLEVPQKRGPATLVNTDERPRRDTSLESLAKLKPAFASEGGTVTAGNSSGLNDGAAALLLMSDARARALQLQPMARVVSSAAAGVPPRVMGYGPIPATRKALTRANLTSKDIRLIELNEAFAVQSLAVIEDLGLDEEIVNVNGGAIALGHPLGCSGARILTTLLHEMRRRAPREKRPYFGLATLCVGVGQGESTIVECLS